MLKFIPSYVSVLFIFTTLVTLFLFYRVIQHSVVVNAKNKSVAVLIILVVWLFIQAVLSYTGVYQSGNAQLPPKILVLGILPALIIILIVFFTKKGRAFFDGLPLKSVTFLNVVRIPVEIVLWLLCIYKAVPEIMTFGGYNFDIIAGLTAPLISYLIVKGKISGSALLLWNLIALALLLNIVTIALLSAPSPIQQFAFDQPNIAILNFPFSWLPTFIVPVVLFGHLVSIRRLVKRKT